MRTDKIYLVGFMGAGKSTLADALGVRLGWRVEDIDALVERRERLTVAEIFARRGEPHFRAVERAVLTDLLPSRYVVIATGGGTYADGDNRALINCDGISIWLDVSWKQVIERLPTDGRRPLAARPLRDGAAVRRSTARLPARPRATRCRARLDR